MADLYSSAFPEPGTTPQPMVDQVIKGGKVRAVTSKIALAATVAAGDLVHVAKLPSSARLLPESTIYYPTGLTGLNDVDFGDANDPDGLVDGEDMSSAGSCSAVKKIAAADYDKRLWELLGYSSDPHTELDLYATLVAELTGSGTVTFDLRYVTNGT